MANLPYIHLYIGDWEQDTNILSLEAEGGWLKIIFKMWKDDKSGVYKTPTKHLQNLWRKNPEETQLIINELKDANICEIEQQDGYVTFRNRRMLRDKDISVKRSKAVQNRYKDPTNVVENRDYDNDNDIDNDSNTGNDIEKRKQNFKIEVDKFVNVYTDHLLAEFFSYWTEANPGGKKMRFEMQKVFDISRRLGTWERNNKKFNKNTSTDAKQQRGDLRQAALNILKGNQT